MEFWRDRGEPLVSARLYVEGGGDDRELRTRCRKAFSKFLEKADLGGRLPRIVACGPRRQAYRQFCQAFAKGQADFVVLLVDSERPLCSGSSAWKHLGVAPDNWAKPSGADEDNAHLMVQCMEAWLIADPDALAAHFGNGFRKSALPSNQNVEQVSKADLLDGLAAAIGGTKERRYHKGRHSFKLLERIDPTLVEGASPNARRFLDAMRANCRAG